MPAFHYDMVIVAETQAEADRVMVERIGYDEELSEYGVGDYTIDARPVPLRALTPLEVCEWFVNNATDPAWCCNFHMYDGTGDYPATAEHPDECPFAEKEES